MIGQPPCSSIWNAVRLVGIWIEDSIGSAMRGLVTLTAADETLAITRAASECVQGRRGITYVVVVMVVIQVVGN